MVEQVADRLHDDALNEDSPDLRRRRWSDEVETDKAHSLLFGQNERAGSRICDNTVANVMNEYHQSQLRKN